MALNFYAHTLLSSRDFPAADCALSEAEAIQVSPFQSLILLDTRAMLSMERGDLDSASHAFARLREAWRSAGFRNNEASATLQLADIEFRRQQFQRAAELFYEAISLAGNDRTNALVRNALVHLGTVLAISGEIHAAVGPVIEAIMLWATREPRHRDVSQAIELLAYIAAAKGDLERSARLAGYADASLARTGWFRDYMPQAVYERLTTRLREQLAPDELARLTTEGASLTSEAAIALARTLETNLGT
jgi:tetratricopeptide (TPR) repeat protein